MNLSSPDTNQKLQESRRTHITKCLSLHVSEIERVRFSEEQRRKEHKIQTTKQLIQQNSYNYINESKEEAQTYYLLYYSSPATDIDSP